MLVLSRHRDERICIGPDVIVTVVELRGDKVRLGIDAPIEVQVDRYEVAAAKRRDGELRDPPLETAIHLLSDLPLDDSEAAHKQADNILLAYLRATGSASVADAWEEAKMRFVFWYS